ncbi:hypothetical protein [Azoarcus sp. KH32C]|uniref:hypothetical protein n=1 Tax=Azoarcus sp. KH32C TaxID=748247 RepID=UPI0002386B37|nr:hypothetical protein [Azoarcus sp. KH32C]BAL23818.1 hypothetical protein AZKH_1497 [Azoarcus sp. KH32C]
MTSPIPQTPANYDSTRIIERPDGFYWQDKETGKEFGPFATLMKAVEDMEFSGADTDIEVGETPGQAGEEVGIADWIDPETGLPAEESVPRTEDN